MLRPFMQAAVTLILLPAALAVTDLDASRLAGVTHLALDVKVGAGGRCGNQLNDGLIADQGLAAPVLGDKGERMMFELVPLAGTGRQITYGDGHAEFVGKSL